MLLANTEEGEVRTIGEKLVRAVSSINSKYNDENVQITCSVGGATIIPNYQDSNEGLLKQADIALYQAKNNGRNQYQSCDQVPSAVT